MRLMAGELVVSDNDREMWILHHDTEELPKSFCTMNKHQDLHSSLSQCYQN